MAKQSEFSAYGPANNDAVALIPAERAQTLPTNPSHMQNPLVYDAKFWAENGEALTKRFNNWLAQ